VTLPADHWEQRINLLRLLSVQMLELAQADRWDEVIEWEAKRRALLNELFQQPSPPALAPLLENAARAALASDARLIELARGEMDKLGGVLQSFHQGRRASQAYQSL